MTSKELVEILRKIKEIRHSIKPNVKNKRTIKAIELGEQLIRDFYNSTDNDKENTLSENEITKINNILVKEKTSTNHLYLFGIDTCIMCVNNYHSEN